MHVNKLLIAVYLCFLTVAWGLSWPFMKIGIQYMAPFTFSGLRFLVGGFVLLLLLFFKKNLKKSLKNAAWRPIILLGFLQTFAVFSFITYAMLFVDAGKTSIILYTMPIWSSVLGAVFLKETITRQNMIGMLFGSVGLALIIGTDLYKDISWENIIGIFLILLASISWASANVVFRLKFTGTNHLPVTTFQMLFGAAGLLILALFFESSQPITWTSASIFSVLFTGIVAGAICFSIWYYLLRVITTVTATISTMLVPVCGVLFGHFLLNETLTVFMLLGGVCILAGIFVSQVQWKKTKKNVQHTEAKATLD
ncbi:DMT family transporter [Bacillus piscicola]|uniref:DMT family transporter n=1 Tax=Bacillus piscicola TaxID=1632684 RepID=UPI001F09C000|nr:DMT family transporter [Bacillus piscicola]